MNIFIDNARFHAYHGVGEQEQIVGGDFTVSVSIEYDFSHAALTDELEDTISYADLYNIICEEMAIPSKLLEHVAGRICRHILHDFPQVTGGIVTITKLNPPLGADCKGMGVQMRVKKKEKMKE